MRTLSKLKLYTNDIVVGILMTGLVIILSVVYFIRSFFKGNDVEYRKGRISSLYEDRMFVILPHHDIEKSIIEFKIPHYLYSYYWEGAEVKLLDDKGEIKLIDPLTNEPLKF